MTPTAFVILPDDRLDPNSAHFIPEGATDARG